jgi:hypothetical protein
MFDKFSQALNRWASQDVARRNAGRASVRMQHNRRQREEVLGFLDRARESPGPHRDEPGGPGRRPEGRPETRPGRR